MLPRSPALAFTMLSLPLPIVVALLLTLLLLQQRDHVTGVGRVLVVLCIAQSVLVGLRFGYGVEAVRWLQPALAVAIPPLAHLGLRRLQGARRFVDSHTFVEFATLLAAVLLAQTLAAGTPLLDLLLFGVYGVYGVLILRAIRAGENSLSHTSLARSGIAVIAWRAIGSLMLASAALDALIALLFASGQSHWVPLLLNLQGAGTLLLVGWAAVAGGWSHEPVALADAPDDRPAADTPSVDAQDAAPDAAMVDAVGLLDAVDGRMRAEAWYRDAELNLVRLAELARVAPRRLSAAINQAHGMNVSQYVNGYRVREAQQRLRAEALPVTTIMYEVGFQTKSNFNREFRRVAGMSPSEWRQSR